MKYISSILEREFGESITKELLTEYYDAKQSHWIDDPQKCLLHSARFCEVSIEAIKTIAFPKEKANLNNIQFGKIFDKLINLPKNTGKEEILFLVIPQILKGIFNLRNKKRVAHIKVSNADKLDAEIVMTNCNWVLSQFIILFDGKNTDETIAITNSLLEKKIPSIQEFEDGELMILKKRLDLKEQLILILYHFSTRIPTKELNKILKPKKSSYISTYSKILEKEKMVNKTKEGVILTKIGIKFIEENSSKFF